MFDMDISLLRELDGFRFKPTDEELVGYYLQNYVDGTLPESDLELIRECDLYGEEEPWEIWDRFYGKSLLNLEDELYFFTKLKKVSLAPGSKSYSRKVGLSTEASWHGENGTKVHVNGLVAHKRRYSYQNQGSDQNKGWILHEFKLSCSDLVLCLLKRNQPNADHDENLLSSSRRRKLQVGVGDYGDDTVITNFSMQFDQKPKRLRFDSDIGGMINENEVKMMPEVDQEVSIMETRIEEQVNDKGAVMNGVDKAWLGMELMVQEQDGTIAFTDDNIFSLADIDDFCIDINDLLGVSSDVDVQETITEMADPCAASSLDQAEIEFQALLNPAVPSPHTNELFSTAEFCFQTSDRFFTDDYSLSTHTDLEKFLLGFSEYEEAVLNSYGFVNDSSPSSRVEQPNMDCNYWPLLQQQILKTNH